VTFLAYDLADAGRFTGAAFAHGEDRVEGFRDPPIRADPGARKSLVEIALAKRQERFEDE
jgi:hypothetical protein